MDTAPDRKQGVFLTAEWRHLVMLNYPIERALLEPLLPPGLELDEFGSITYVSVVGFLFLQTRVLGIPFPFHRNFEEHRAPEGWHRGVVFVREIVPRRAIAKLARLLYGEPYLAFPMTHAIERDAEKLRYRYTGQRDGRAIRSGRHKPLWGWLRRLALCPARIRLHRRRFGRERAARKSARLAAGTAQQFAQDKLEDAAVAVIIDLDRRIDPQLHRHALGFAGGPLDREIDQLTRLDGIRQAGHTKNLRAVQA
jgi:hypothetical protein